MTIFGLSSRRGRPKLEGMPRPLWTGSISFGLVNIPIKLVSATESHRVAFHEFEEGSGHRVRNKRVAEGSGREVPWEKIQKGFEVAKDRFVVLTDEELAAAAPERTHTIEIEHFVPLGEIDPASFDQAYFAAPDGAAADKAYVLLRDAMRDAGRVAVGRFVMRTKEYVACIRPLGQALALQTLFFAGEGERARARDGRDAHLVARRAVEARGLRGLFSRERAFAREEEGPRRRDRHERREARGGAPDRRPHGGAQGHPRSKRQRANRKQEARDHQARDPSTRARGRPGAARPAPRPARRPRMIRNGAFPAGRARRHGRVADAPLG
jgi:Ku protein